MNAEKPRKHLESHPEEKQIQLRQLLKEENIFKVNIRSTGLKHAPTVNHPWNWVCWLSSNKLRKMPQL